MTELGSPLLRKLTVALGLMGIGVLLLVLATPVLAGGQDQPVDQQDQESGDGSGPAAMATVVNPQDQGSGAESNSVAVDVPAYAEGQDDAGESDPAAVDWGDVGRDELTAGDREFERQIADGWIAHGDRDGSIVGWVSVDALNGEDFFYEGRVPVFDEPRGSTVVGYSYKQLGFVDVVTADSDTFDLQAALDEKYGNGVLERMEADAAERTQELRGD